MPITLNCSCGKTLRIADEHAGKRVKCPACNAVIASTPPSPQFEVVEDEPRQALTSARPVAKPIAKPRDDDDDDTDSYGMTAAAKTPDPPRTKPTFRKRADSDEDDDDRPRRRRRRGGMSRAAGARAGDETGKRIGYIIGGAALLLIGGVVAYFAWENRTRGLIFGIILAISGLITLSQGITGNIDDEE